jgi:photosystem II stability/assembly factor-like uncharacterized protein
MKPVSLTLFALLTSCTSIDPVLPPPEWVRLETEPAQDRQDDISLIDSETGWYVNSVGRIFKTGDGGRSWSRLVDRKGTYWRTIHFIDGRRGFAGNLGTGAIEGFRTVMSSAEFRNLDENAAITDPTWIYETLDGGLTWTPAEGVPRGPGGICSMSSVRDASGRPIVFAGGRVTGPARLFRWTEGGGWESIDLAGLCGMVLDVAFLDERNGVVCAATGADPAVSFASMLRTADGGRTWSEVYRSNRRGESVWKCSFPTPDVGYATIRPFPPDPKATLRYIVKSVDGGRTWKELFLIDDFYARPQGVGFLTADHGWVGTTTSGFETRDGGESWARVNMGRSINRIRVLPAPGGGHVVYAIGQDLFRMKVD